MEKEYIKKKEEDERKEEENCTFQPNLSMLPKLLVFFIQFISNKYSYKNSEKVKKPKGYEEAVMRLQLGIEQYEKKIHDMA